MLPMTDADMPRSCPSSGTAKVCTSQQEASIQLTSSRRRNGSSFIRSQARCGGPAAAITRGRSPAVRTPNQGSSGSTALSAKGAREQDGKKGEGGGEAIDAGAAGVVYQLSGQEGADEVGHRRPDGQPTEDLLELRRVMGGGA